MPTKTEQQTAQDVLAWEAYPDYCRERVTFRHTAGVNASFYPGEVLEIISTKYNPLAAAANAVAVLLEPVLDLATATDKLNVLVLRRGPAMVNENKLDVNGQVLATVMTALAALSPPILSKTPPTVKTTISA